MGGANKNGRETILFMAGHIRVVGRVCLQGEIIVLLSDQDTNMGGNIGILNKCGTRKGRDVTVFFPTTKREKMRPMKNPRKEREI